MTSPALPLPAFAALLAGSLLLAGCGDSATEPSGGASTGGLSSTVTEAAEAARKTAAEAAATASQTATEVAATASKAADDVRAAVNARFQSLVEQAQKLIADGKASEAMAALRQLADLKLTPEQQKTVDDLMARAQKTLAGGTEAARKALDGLLKK